MTNLEEREREVMTESTNPEEGQRGNQFEKRERRNQREEEERMRAGDIRRRK